jgi:hypothetical protein
VVVVVDGKAPSIIIPFTHAVLPDKIVSAVALQLYELSVYVIWF